MIKKIDNFLDQISLWAVLISVLTMLSLTVFSILMRQFEVTYLWLDPLVRHLVFLATFLGGSIAVGRSQHIKIDILGRLLESREKGGLRKLLRVVVLIITAVAVVFLMNSSIQLVELEFEDNNIAFLGIHTGYLIGIITIGMGLILLRIVLQILLQLSRREEN